MKTTRTYALLSMFFLLEEKGRFTEKEICEELELSRASFYRAINDFRCFLLEYRPWQELIFTRSGHYELESQRH